MHKFEFTFIPFNIVPYNQDVDWNRPESKQKVVVNGYGSRQVTLLKAYTTITENIKTCGASFVDTVTNANTEYLKPTCAYDPKTITKYDDAYWLYEPLAKMDSLKNWYGSAKWWNSNFYTQA